jgi:hypothetical protein
MATTFPNSPRHAKGALTLMDPDSANFIRFITLQINPALLTRSLKVRGAGREGGDRSAAMRLTRPPMETNQVEAEDATDKLEYPKQNEAKPSSTSARPFSVPRTPQQPAPPAATPASQVPISAQAQSEVFDFARPPGRVPGPRQFLQRHGGRLDALFRVDSIRAGPLPANRRVL